MRGSGRLVALLLAAICAVCLTGCAGKNDTRTFSGPHGGVTFSYPSSLKRIEGAFKSGSDQWAQAFVGAHGVTIEAIFLPTESSLDPLEGIVASLKVSSPQGPAGSKRSAVVVRATRFLRVSAIVGVSCDYDFTSSDSQAMRETDVAVPLASGTLVVEATAPPDSWPQAQAMLLGVLRSLKLADPQPAAASLDTYDGEHGFSLTLPAAFKQVVTAPRSIGPWRLMGFSAQGGFGMVTTMVDFAWTPNILPSAAQPQSPAIWRRWATYISRSTVGGPHSKALAQHLLPVDGRQQAWHWQFVLPEKHLHAVFYAELAGDRMAMVLGSVRGHEWFLRQELLEAIGMSLIDNTASSSTASPSPL